MAGLAAYFIALGNEIVAELDVSTPQLVKDYIMEKAHPRGEDRNVKYIYNGVRPADARGGWDGPVSQPDISFLATPPSRNVGKLAGADLWNSVVGRLHAGNWARMICRIWRIVTKIRRRG